MSATATPSSSSNLPGSNPAADPGATTAQGNDPQKNPTQTPQQIDPAEFARLRAENESLKSRAAELEQDWNNVRTLNTATDPAAADAAARAIYKKLGYTDAQTEEAMGGGNSAPQGKQGRKQQSEDDDADPVTQKLSTVEERLNKVETANLQQYQAQVQQQFNTVVKSGLDSSPEFGKLLGDLVNQRPGDPQATAANKNEYIAHALEAVSAAVKTKLREAQTREGVQWNPNWMTTLVPQATKQAAADYVTKMRKYVPDNALTGAPAVQNPFLDAQGKPPPSKAKPGANTSEVQDTIHKWGAHKLLADDSNSILA